MGRCDAVPIKLSHRNIPVLHTLRERSCKVDRKKGERYGKEFRRYMKLGEE